jgi:hypothetical protein
MKNSHDSIELGGCGRADIKDVGYAKDQVEHCYQEYLKSLWNGRSKFARYDQNQSEWYGKEIGTVC